MSEDRLREFIRGGVPYDVQRQAKLIDAVKDVLDKADTVLIESYTAERHPNNVSLVSTLTLRLVQNVQTSQSQKPSLAERLARMKKAKETLHCSDRVASPYSSAISDVAEELYRQLQERCAEQKAAAR